MHLLRYGFCVMALYLVVWRFFSSAPEVGVSRCKFIYSWFSGCLFVLGEFLILLCFAFPLSLTTSSVATVTCLSIYTA
ncbi:uncharacterized protein BP01DRAFT_141934 [Aspergillus saccharolyticus JOP 1030-1]|uniref:Uncharacterized protein n=1 Tax=Aspergillus saccharolyticus JOP 1030-1 TaxID=1450539 RepID=A0A318Z469_9EURO|nr:hypothetical protein BP01DRAFT_141934 [Aspergillus saccharolyticus JOP 1030-1]PYH42121.1 hypothetical protein BP01DRAFT_141934 [Aspergillus saccharolyticus JOP 1030-1]